MSFFYLFKDFQLLFFRDRSSRYFITATIIGLMFSLAVILCSLALMDGFGVTLKKSLNAGSGEIILTATNGFFELNENEQKDLDNFPIQTKIPMLRTQSFVNKDEKGKAVFVVGVNDKINQLDNGLVEPGENEVIIGDLLAQDLKVKVGDTLKFSFSAGKLGERYLPTNAVLKVKDIKTFKIHEYRNRFVYVNLKKIQTLLGVKDRINLMSLRLKPEYRSLSKINEVVADMKSVFYYEYTIAPYWSDFATFLKAVEFEKYMISIVFSIVVILAIFNCLAFIIFSKERRSQEIFLLYAIGLSPKKFRTLWMVQNIGIWLIAFLGSLVCVEIFDYLLSTLDIFSLPTDVYHLNRIELFLSLRDIFIVGLISFIFIIFLTFVVLKRLDSKSMAQGLREEFS
ncbi:FtsX-like permease family protein [Halobacteriovorax sp. RT-2-4]|uniref:FtsX-like permease family protein n=1 Tax=unclassified Halobacteriovorax TaxID=2639665 RepID=UPI003999D93E